MKIIRITKKNYPRSKIIREAREALRRGGTVVLPTDTVYGIGANMYDPKALRKLFLLKQRRESRPAPVFVRDLGAAKRLAIIPKKYEPLLKKYWPGPLTAIFPIYEVQLRKSLTKLNFVNMVAPKGKIGLRVPDHRFLLALLKKIDFPITGTSANISGQPPCRSAKAFLKQLKKANSKVWSDLVIDGGSLPRRKPSTVVDFSGAKPKILRRGPIVLEKKPKV